LAAMAARTNSKKARSSDVSSSPMRTSLRIKRIKGSGFRGPGIV
jgi:hypothetical protein